MSLLQINPNMHPQPLSEREIFFRHLGLTALNPPALQFSEARGIYLHTPDGEAYTDLSAGYSVCNLGHSHPAVVEAVVAQARRYMHQTVYGEFVQSPQVKLARMLAGVLPASLNCVFLVNSGSEAIEGAMKLAKRHTGRHTIVSFRNAYHGSTQGALSLMGDETLKAPFRPLLPGVLQLRFNHFGDLERIDETVACVVIEPVQAEAGVVVPAEGYLQALRAKCTETGALLVFDEIQTGFGRTGSLFAFVQSGVVPDVLCLAKALGGGMPIGAFVADRSVMHALAFDPPLGHLTTFGGNPLSAAAACASIETLTGSRLYEDAGQKAKLLLEGITRHEAVAGTRNAGLLAAIQFKNSETASKALETMWENRLISDRFLFCHDALRLSPPLIITHEECVQVNALLNRILKHL